MDLKQAQLKSDEIERRFKLCIQKLGGTQKIYECPTKHYMDAQSILGTIHKNQRVTERQAKRLTELSFMLFEWPHPQGRHFC